MSTNVFISFENHDRQRMLDIRALANNPIHDLEFHDWSETEPVRDRVGTPLPYQPDDSRSRPIKTELRRLLRNASKMVVVIGEFTHESNWVNWEIQSFYDRMNNAYGDAQRRIIGIYVPDTNRVTLPSIIRTYSVPRIQWDMDALARWINVNPTQNIRRLNLPLV